ncbi:MAG: hypothetical protein MnENMB40S_28910 [Rhizobiaceae bacterium MnEN-MB40S]|nr:MAG: hypothetical protein MnENMB40S_28910 [Rhizobiaceae bacterium MnEN-MB40S]
MVKLPILPPTEASAAFFAVLAMLMGACRQGALNREQMIDHLLETIGDLSPQERDGPYGGYLQLAVRFFEGTQFPDDSSTS